MAGRAENPLDRLAGGVFVGREKELAELRDAVDEALGGRGRLVLLVGEPGIGKTRTAEELATYARLRGAQVLWGRCYEGEGAPRLLALGAGDPLLRPRAPTRSALAWEMGAGRRRHRPASCPRSRERLARSPAPPTSRTSRPASGFFDAIATFLPTPPASRPLVLVLDDLHWADEPSLLLLQFIARGARDAALLVIGTYRDVELGRHHPLSRALGELVRAGSRAGSSCAASAGGGDRQLHRDDRRDRAPAGAGREAVHEQTEGNPFFVGEVVRLLASEGALEAGGGGRAADPAGRPRRRRPPARSPLRGRQRGAARAPPRSAATSTRRRWRGSPTSIARSSSPPLRRRSGPSSSIPAARTGATASPTRWSGRPFTRS